MSSSDVLAGSDPVTVLVVDGGPDSGACLVTHGRQQLVGRGRRADLRIDDPLLELHHGVFETRGTWCFVQLAGHTPWLLERGGRQRPGRQREALRPDDVITVGATRLRLAAGRGPVLGSGASGATVVGSAVVGPPAGSVGELAVVLGRRRADGCGVGGPTASRYLADEPAAAVPIGAPVVVGLARHRTLALAGDGGVPVARALIRQLAVDVARPAVFVAVGRPGAWEWAAALDRVALVERDALLDAVVRWRGGVGGRREVVVVTDDEQLVAEGSAVRAAVAGDGALVLAGTPEGLDRGRVAGWSAIAEIGSRFAGRLRLADGTVPTHFAGRTAARPSPRDAAAAATGSG